MLGYKKAIAVMATVNSKADMFERSTMLAHIYERSKEKTLDDLIEYRRKMLGIQKPR
jgi:hypothetical protein